MNYITLDNGVKMPQEGYGVFQIPPEECERCVVVIPKSSRKERMEETLDIWVFTLDSKDMDAIAALDIGHSESINHYLACTVKALNATKIY